MNNSTPVKTARNAKRATYGFNLDFPATPFTIRGLHRQKSGRIKYITLYMRVKKALKDGTLVVSGKADPKKTRKGRKELLFVRGDVKTLITATKAAV